MEKKPITDEQCIAKWKALLAMFHKTINGDPSPESIRGQLEALKTAATNAEELTYRQVDAIIARCDNYLKGQYGNTKTQENLDYQYKK